MTTVWPPELASYVLALVAFIAIIILLANYTDKIQPNWPSLLNINTLLSILATILKTALLFPVTQGISELKWIRFSRPHSLLDIDRWDAASRTTWGSLLLVLKYPGSFLSSLGAAIAVVSITVDPFVQQALQFYSCQQPVDGLLARIPKTQNYTSLASFTSSISLAFFEGLLEPKPSVASSLSVFCPSGNCTFGGPGGGPAYSSVAMCANVSEVSDTIRVRRNATFFEVSLPSGLVARNTTRTGDIKTRAIVASSTVLRFNDTDLNLVQFLTTTGDCVEQQLVSGCELGARAFEVVFVPCLHTYGEPSYTNSVFRERLVSTAYLAFRNGAYSTVGENPSRTGVDCSGSSTPQGEKTQPTVLNERGERTAVYFFDPDVSEPGLLYYHPACVYQMDFQEYLRIMVLLQGGFTSVDQQKNLTYFGGLPNEIANAAPMLRDGDDWLETLWANGTADLAGVRSFFDGVAFSLTAAIRETGIPEYSEPVLGTVFETQTCVGVNWLWLILPGALLLATLVFLVLAIFRSWQYTRPGGEQNGRGAWKSSALPLLWAGLPGSTADRGYDLGDVGEMEKRSDEVLARLERRVVAGERRDEVGGGDDEGERWLLREYRAGY